MQTASNMGAATMGKSSNQMNNQQLVMMNGNNLGLMNSSQQNSSFDNLNNSNNNNSGLPLHMSSSTYMLSPSFNSSNSNNSNNSESPKPNNGNNGAISSPYTSSLNTPPNSHGSTSSIKFFLHRVINY